MKRVSAAVVGWLVVGLCGCETPGGPAWYQVPDPQDPKFLSGSADHAADHFAADRDAAMGERNKAGRR